MGKLKMLWTLAVVQMPEPLAALVFAGRRRVVDGRRIDPKAQALGALFDQVRVPGVTPTLAESRASLRLLAEKFDRPCPASVTRRDITVPGAAGDRPGRLYDTDPDGAMRPTLLFLHGGGWVQGDLETHDGLCGQIALEAGCRVIALDYRLAPEHKFPAGPDDVLAAYRALRERPEAWGVDPTRLAVAGDSAGGNLTAVLMHDIAAAGLPMPRAQLLIYPAVDARMQTRTMQELRQAYVLPVDRIGWYIDQYLPQGQDRLDPRLSPVLSPHLAAQPPACVIVAGHDPLWDDGLMQAEALEQAGVPVEILRYPGQIHIFVSARRVVPQGVEAISRASVWLQRALG
ncbi:MAG: alpha/beta hydrolase [Rhodobacter sp.]|nr:alpha/beta hydrolase [Paracoccaceae bacterium]MCC0077186.1 alpha/beta hydrolase [Rhodobacter sp.]